MESGCEMAAIEPDPIRAEWVSVVLGHNIFLSHSGAQKNFVEQLCEDLEQAKLSPFFDKRTHSLPKGEEFAPLIFTAAQECVLALVVVSEKYFTRSKWPMLELAAITQAPNCKILPLFFGLSCKEFKNPKRRERWFQVWDEWAESDHRICVNVWKNAVRNLDGLNGMEYVKANGEVAFRKEIVTAVCDLMQRRSQDEIIVVERTSTSTLNAGVDNFGDLTPSSAFWPQYDQICTATRVLRIRSMVPCLRTILVVVFQQVVVAFTLLLLYYGYIRYAHKCKAESPSHGRLFNNIKKQVSTTEAEFFAQKERSAESLMKAFDDFYSLRRHQLREFEDPAALYNLGYPRGNVRVKHWTLSSCNSDHVRADELLNVFLNARNKVVDPEETTNEQFSAAAFRSLRPQIYSNFSTVDERRAFFDTFWNSPVCEAESRTVQYIRKREMGAQPHFARTQKSNFRVHIFICLAFFLGCFISGCFIGFFYCWVVHRMGSRSEICPFPSFPDGENSETL